MPKFSDSVGKSKDASNTSVEAHGKADYSINHKFQFHRGEYDIESTVEFNAQGAGIHCSIQNKNLFSKDFNKSLTALMRDDLRFSPKLDASLKTALAALFGYSAQLLIDQIKIKSVTLESAAFSAGVELSTKQIGCKASSQVSAIVLSLDTPVGAVDVKGKFGGTGVGFSMVKGQSKKGTPRTKRTVDVNYGSWEISYTPSEEIAPFLKGAALMIIDPIRNKLEERRLRDALSSDPSEPKLPSSYNPLFPSWLLSDSDHSLSQTVKSSMGSLFDNSVHADEIAQLPLDLKHPSSYAEDTVCAAQEAQMMDHDGISRAVAEVYQKPSMPLSKMPIPNSGEPVHFGPFKPSFQFSWDNMGGGFSVMASITVSQPHLYLPVLIGGAIIITTIKLISNNLEKKAKKATDCLAKLETHHKDIICVAERVHRRYEEICKISDVSERNTEMSKFAVQLKEETDFFEVKKWEDNALKVPKKYRAEFLKDKEELHAVWDKMASNIKLLERHVRINSSNKKTLLEMQSDKNYAAERDEVTLLINRYDTNEALAKVVQACEAKDFSTARQACGGIVDTEMRQKIMDSIAIEQSTVLFHAAYQEFSQEKTKEDLEPVAANLRAALAVNPNHADAIQLLGKCYLYQEKYQEAQEHAESTLLVMDPKDQLGLMVKAEAQLGKGEFAESRKTLISILSSNPENQAACQLLASNYRARISKISVDYYTEDYNERMQAVAFAVENFTADAQALLNAAVALKKDYIDKMDAVLQEEKAELDAAVSRKKDCMDKMGAVLQEEKADIGASKGEDQLKQQVEEHSKIIEKERKDFLVSRADLESHQDQKTLFYIKTTQMICDGIFFGLKTGISRYGKDKDKKLTQTAESYLTKLKHAEAVSSNVLQLCSHHRMQKINAIQRMGNAESSLSQNLGHARYALLFFQLARALGDLGLDWVGCYLYMMPNLPVDLTSYKMSYIYISKGSQKELYYVKPDGTRENVTIQNFSIFNKNVTDIFGQGVSRKLRLSEQQIRDLITSNGGHTRVGSGNTKEVLEKAMDFCDNYVLPTMQLFTSAFSPEVLLRIPEAQKFLLRPDPKGCSPYLRFALGKFLQHVGEEGIFNWLIYMAGYVSYYAHPITAWLNYAISFFVVGATMVNVQEKLKAWLKAGLSFIPSQYFSLVTELLAMVSGYYFYFKMVQFLVALIRTVRSFDQDWDKHHLQWLQCSFSLGEHLCYEQPEEARMMFKEIKIFIRENEKTKEEWKKLYISSLLYEHALDGKSNMKSKIVAQESGLFVAISMYTGQPAEELRTLSMDYIEQHKAEMSGFVVGNFDKCIKKIRNHPQLADENFGELQIRAAEKVLDRTIVVLGSARDEKNVDASLAGEPIYIMRNGACYGALRLYDECYFEQQYERFLARELKLSKAESDAKPAAAARMSFSPHASFSKEEQAALSYLEIKETEKLTGSQTKKRDSASIRAAVDIARRVRRRLTTNDQDMPGLRYSPG